MHGFSVDSLHIWFFQPLYAGVRYCASMSFEEAQARVRDFVAARDWAQFHSPENLSKSIAIEAAELLELFQWGTTPSDVEVADELADVLTYCIILADKLNLDPAQIVLDKLHASREKYPVEKARGRSTKYDKL